MVPGSHNPEETSRRRMIVGVVALVVALVAAGAIIAYAALGRRTSPSQPTPYTPAQSTTATPQSGAGASATVGTSGTVQPTSSVVATTTSAGAAWKRGPKIAFRLGLSLYVANEDGSDARAVAQSADVSAYAVSPDGTAIALVSPDGALTVREIGTGAQLFQTQSQKSAPRWSSDSKHLAFTAGQDPDAYAVVVNRDGTGRTQWAGYSAPQFSPDGAHAAVLAGSASKGTVAVISLPSGKPHVLAATKGEFAFAWASPNKVAYLTPDSASSSSATSTAYSLFVVGADGSAASKYGTWSYDPLATPTDLLTSADHRWVVVTESGDDGYSSTWVMPWKAGATRTAVSKRRATYAYGFSGDGKFLFYFEGNTFQGESSELMRLRLGGAQRVPIVSGATP